MSSKHGESDARKWAESIGQAKEATLNQLEILDGQYTDDESGQYGMRICNTCGRRLMSTSGTQEQWDHMKEHEVSGEITPNPSLFAESKATEQDIWTTQSLVGDGATFDTSSGHTQAGDLVYHVECPDCGKLIHSANQEELIEDLDYHRGGHASESKAREIDTLDSISQAEFDSPYDDLSEDEKQEVNSIMDDPWQGESKASEVQMFYTVHDKNGFVIGTTRYDNFQEADMLAEAESGAVYEHPGDGTMGEKISDYTENAVYDQDAGGWRSKRAGEYEGEDEPEYQDMSNVPDAEEHDVEITEPATEYDVAIDPEEDETPEENEDGQAGNVWQCPECGFNTISKDEYDNHSHSNVPATVGKPQSEESIAQPSNDYNILQRFR